MDPHEETGDSAFSTMPTFPGEEIQRREDAVFRGAKPEPEPSFSDWLRHAWAPIALCSVIGLGFLSATIVLVYLLGWIAGLMVLLMPVLLGGKIGEYANWYFRDE